MTKRWTAIVNKAAGGGRHIKSAENAVSRLMASDLDVDIQYTTHSGHATELVSDAVKAGCRHFVSIGGDGTSFEVVNGIFTQSSSFDAPPTLGIVPLGTGNSFVRDFDTPDGDAVDRILAASEVNQVIDVVRCDHEDGCLHYINLLGLGFTADAGALMNKRFKSLGTAGYIASVLVTLARITFPSDGIRIDGNDKDARPAAFICFSNSRYTGGAMMMAPHASLSDGKLDVIRVNRMGRLRFLGAFPSIFSGKHVEHPRIEETTARRVEFLESRVQNVMVDGEIYPLALKSLEVVPSALRVIV